MGLVVYQSPHSPMVSFSAGSVLSDVMLESPQQFALADFTVHVKASADKAAQEFMASMATVGLSQVISGPAHQAGHT